MASSMISTAAVATRSSPAQASMVAPFTGLKSASAFPITKKSADITSLASNGGRAHCMKVWPPINKKKYETLSYLPSLTDSELAKDGNSISSLTIAPKRPAGMASSKVMASTSPPNPDLPRQSASTIHSSSSTGLTQTTPSSVSNLLQQPNPPQPSPTNNLHYSDRTNSPFGSMNMEEILKNIYSEPDSLASAVDDAGISGVPAIDGTGGVVKNVGAVGNKTVDEVWKEIVTGAGAGGGSREPRMTLEDFLTKAGAVSEEDVRVHNSAPPPVTVPVPVPVPPPAPASGGYGVDAMMNVQFPVAPGPVVHMQNEPGGFGLESQLGFGNGMVAAASAALGGHGGNGCASGRGKRRAAPVEELALDKATQQKQRRMIKNRESAARSRERKQAYTVELESLVAQLEEENARLLREEEEQNKERFKQLMENLIPVVEKRRPPRVLRRVNSSTW